MGVASAESREKRSKKASEGDQGVSSESAEKQIEPNYIRLYFSDSLQNMN